MKKIQLLSILVLSGAVLFGGKAAAHKAKVNFKESSLARTESAASVADLMIDSDRAIHGLQFDISYNPAEIKFSFVYKFQFLTNFLSRNTRKL